MMKPITGCFIGLLAGLLPCVDVGAEHYDVYVLAGQSNMDGRGVASELTEAQRVPIDNAIIYYRNELISSEGWKPLATGFSVPPKHKSGLPSPTFGPEIGFARAMSQSSRAADGSLAKLALIKGSRGGTSLRKDWNPGIQGDPQSQGPQYRDMIETIGIALAELEQRGDTWECKGLLWHQGESDSQSSAKVHQGRLNALIARFREDLQVDDLPVVLGQVDDNGKRDGVREAIEAVSGQGVRVGLVAAEGLTTWDEGTHFDAKSQLEMGERFAEQVIRIQGFDK